METLEIVGRCKGKTSQNYTDALKLVNARISNLESNLHIEIDMERVEDRSKALSYIGIEIAEALKLVTSDPKDFSIDHVSRKIIGAMKQIKEARPHAGLVKDMSLRTLNLNKEYNRL